MLNLPSTAKFLLMLLLSVTTSIFTIYLLCCECHFFMIHNKTGRKTGRKYYMKTNGIFHAKVRMAFLMILFACC